MHVQIYNSSEFGGRLSQLQTLTLAEASETKNVETTLALSWKRVPRGSVGLMSHDCDVKARHPVTSGHADLPCYQT